MSDRYDGLLALAARIEIADNEPIAISPSAADAIRSLHAENERLRADAERYRYIRWALSNAKFDYYSAEDSSEPEIDAQVDEERAALANETTT